MKSDLREWRKFAEFSGGESMPAQNMRAEKTAQTEIIETISEIAGIKKIGLLSAAEDTAILFAGGKEIKRYLDGTVICEAELKIFCRSAAQLSAAERSHEICNKLCSLRGNLLPEKNNWKVCRIKAVSMPSLDIQSDRTWLYSAELSVNYFLKTRKE